MYKDVCLLAAYVKWTSFLFSEWTEKISAAAQAALWNVQQSCSNHEEAAQEEQRHYQDRTRNGQGAQGGSLWELCQCEYIVLSVAPLLPHIHVLLTAHIFTPSKLVICLFLNINQLDALNFIISLFQTSTCFEHVCSSSGEQNCIIQSLVSSHLQVAVPCTGRPPIGVMIPETV